MDDTEKQPIEPANGNAGAGGPGDRARPPHLDVDLLNAYLDGSLEPDAYAAASAHLATCDHCRRDLAELRATVALLHSLPEFRPRRSFQLSPEQARPVTRGWLTRLLPALPALRAATVAVAIALLAVVAGDIVSNDNGGDNDANVARAPAVVATQPAAAPTAIGGAGPEPTRPAVVGTEPTIAAFFEMETPSVAPTSGASLPAPPPASTAPPAPTSGPTTTDNFGSDTMLAEAPESTGGEAGAAATGGEAETADSANTAGAASGEEQGPTDVDQDQAATADEEEPAHSAADEGLAQRVATEESAPESAESGDALGDAASAAEADSETMESMAVAEEPEAATMPPSPSPTAPTREAATPASSPAASPTATAVASPTATPAIPPVAPSVASPAATSAATPGATPNGSPAGSPQPTAATPAQQTPTDATPEPPQSTSEGGDGVSGWRVAEIGLVVVLAWLLVSMVGLSRLRRQREGS